MVNRLNDATLDTQHLVDAFTAVADEATGSSDVYDLKQADPSTFNVRVIWSWPAINVGVLQTLTIAGSPTADFSAGYFILGQRTFGAPDAISTATGVTPLGYLGSGEYVIPCSNVGSYTDGGTGLPAVKICRYIQVFVTTTGTDSACAFQVLVEQK